MVSLTFAFQVPYYARSEWTIERHHFEAQYGEPLETIDDDLVVIHARLDDLFGVINERLDDLFDAVVVRPTKRHSTSGGRSTSLFGIPSLLRGRCASSLARDRNTSLVRHLTPVNSTSFDVQGTWERAPSSTRHGEALLAAKPP
jgi:hypothetical protein